GLRAARPRSQRDGRDLRRHSAGAHGDRGDVDLGRARRADEPERGHGCAASPAPEFPGRRRLRRHRGGADGPQPPGRHRRRRGAVRRLVSGRLGAVVRHAEAHAGHGRGHPGADHSRLRRARARAARAARYARPPRDAGSDTVSDALLLMALLAAATARGATPLVLAALGGLFAERSGIVDIGLEGKMLAAAFAAAATAAVTGSAWAGLAAGIAASVLIGLVHGFACITHHGNQVISGMALNITISGLTVVLGYAWFQEGGQTPMLGPGARFAP